MLILWIVIFIASLAVLVKSADWVVESSEKIGLALKLSPFIVGVTIVAIGTSFPELATTLIATFKGNTEFVVDTAFGSNIATILLIVGLATVVGRKLIVKRSLIDLDAPLFAVSTVLILFMALDRKIVFWEGVLLILGFIVYFLYTIFQRGNGEEETPEAVEVLPLRPERREARIQREIKEEKKKIVEAKLSFKIFLFLTLGIAGLVIGSNYIVESVSSLSELLKINASFITITAVAVGTSLPELVVSVGAALKKKYELALGNVFGSNVFTIFLVIGLPALIKPLAINETTFSVGLPYLVVATLLFVVSGISRRIHIWEGLMYILIFVLFIAQFFGLF
ncbi:calcium/sodium antiporter [Patescibacteria group bacterium]|nr:calcium/sodium antiporter [Patescibacteria group bacterium]